jgi:Trypsin-like peptidase domain
MTRLAEAIGRRRKVPPEKRDEWHLPTLAEASLGLDDWGAVEAGLKGYVADEKAQAFQIASTLRQFTQVWDIEAIDERGRALADILRARLLEVSGGEILLAPQTLQQARTRPDPPPAQLEAVLGELGAKTWKWWRSGLDRASSVCSVRTKVGDRMGTGWLVRAGALNREPADELLVMTNFHVVNAQGAHNGIAPESAEIVFEAVDANRAYTVRQIVWSSPPDRHDCSLLRLAEPLAAGLQPLPLARGLPLVDAMAHVYVIGHPGGRDLAFSLQDNALLDHEGPPNGKATIEGVCRVHYRAPTEGGSSGSPVFNAALWEVIALHHSGGKLGMPRLNGQGSTYAANEGIAVQSIIAAMAQQGS